MNVWENKLIFSSAEIYRTTFCVIGYIMMNKRRIKEKSCYTLWLYYSSSLHFSNIGTHLTNVPLDLNLNFALFDVIF